MGKTQGDPADLEGNIFGVWFVGSLEVVGVMLSGRQLYCGSDLVRLMILCFWNCINYDIIYLNRICVLLYVSNFREV